jgi:hypothetical protein
MKINVAFTGLLTFLILNASYVKLWAQTDLQNPLPQFLFGKFSPGTVKMKAGNKYTTNLNYNMVEEEMIFEQKGNYMALSDIRNIDTVLIQNRAFVPVGEVFYEVISSGKAPFFIQHKSKYSEVGTPTAYGMTSPTNSSIKVNSVRNANTYRSIEVPENVTISPANVNWVSKDGVMNKFSGEKNFLRLFPGKESELKAFIKANKTNFKTREDLVKLGDYLNSILD